MTCEAALLAAAIGVSGHLQLSTEHSTSLAIYRSPSAQMRLDAELLEMRDRAIVELRRALDLCKPWPTPVPTEGRP